MPFAPWPESIDTSQDYLIDTNYITIIYLAKTGEQIPGLEKGIPISHVLAFPIDKGHLPSDSILLLMDRTFRFAKATMQGIVPEEFDIIIDDQGIRWVVGPAEGCIEVLSFGNEYRIHTKKTGKQGVPVG